MDLSLQEFTSRRQIAQVPRLSKLRDVVRQQIRELRRSRGLTQEELCERAGISIDAISRIEGGTRVPSLDTLEKIAAALHVSPAAFFDAIEAPAAAIHPAPLQRVVTLLEPQAEPVLTLAESVVTAVVRAYDHGRRQPRRRRKS